MISIIANEKTKSEICKKILKDLPEWFGLEAANKSYIEGVRDKLFFAYKDKDEYLGFVSLEETSDISCDMYVLGVLKKYHKEGIGTKLVKFAENEARKLNKEYIIVKTLSDSDPDKNYQKTRAFYFKNGYRMLEELKDLWGEDNPCAYWIKELYPSRILDISENLRLRRIEKSDYKTALKWYQNKELLKISENITNRVYDMETINDMYDYLSSIGELYFIEIFDSFWKPIGDVTLSKITMAILIGDTSYLEKGIGKKVIKCLLERAKMIGYTTIKLDGIYKFNKRSINLFRSCGFIYLNEDDEKIYLGIEL